MNEPAHNYSRTRYGGGVVNQRTRDMLVAAEKINGHPFTLTQGSYNKGVSASAGTHDGGGVVDISVGGMDGAQRNAAVQALRRVGFFAWLRTPPSFAYHIHAVAIGDREMSPSARNQVKQGFADRDGLARHGPDPAPDPYPAWTAKYGKHASPDPAPAGPGPVVYVVNGPTGKFVTQTDNPQVWAAEALKILDRHGKVGGYKR